MFGMSPTTLIFRPIFHHEFSRKLRTDFRLPMELGIGCSTQGPPAPPNHETFLATYKRPIRHLTTTTFREVKRTLCVLAGTALVLTSTEPKRELIQVPGGIAVVSVDHVINNLDKSRYVSLTLPVKYAPGGRAGSPYEE